MAKNKDIKKLIQFNSDGSVTQKSVINEDKPKENKSDSGKSSANNSDSEKMGNSKPSQNVWKQAVEQSASRKKPNTKSVKDILNERKGPVNIPQSRRFTPRTGQTPYRKSTGTAESKSLIDVWSDTPKAEETAKREAEVRRISAEATRKRFAEEKAELTRREEEKENKAVEERTNRIENNKRKAQDEYTRRQLAKNKTLENLTARNDLVDTGTHIPTKEILELGYGPLNTKEGWNDVQVANNPDDIEHVTNGYAKYKEKYKQEYGIDYDDGANVIDPKTGKYTSIGERELDYMNTNQANTYLYILDVYGEKEAHNYYYYKIKNDEEFKHTKAMAETYRQNYNSAVDSPIGSVVKEIMGNIAMPFVQGIYDIFRPKSKRTQEEINSEYELAMVFEGNRDGRSSKWEPVIGSFLTEFANLAVGVSDDAVIGWAMPTKSPYINNMLEGVITGGYDKKHDQALAGTLETDNANTEVLASSLFDAMLSPLVGKINTKGGEKLLKQIPDGTLRRYVGELIFTGLNGSSIGVSRSVADSIANVVLMGDNSNYNQAYESYLSSEMSENDAVKNAINDAFIKPAISSAISLGILGTIRGIPNEISKHIDLTGRGKDISNGVRSTYEAGLKKLYGDKLSDSEIKSMAKNIISDDNIIDSVLNAAGKYDENSLAAKNAKLLRARLSDNKKISMSQLGAQDILNQAEAYSFFRYAQGMKTITGVSTKMDVDMNPNEIGYYKKGIAHISSTADEPLKETADHEYGHGIQEGASGAYKVYTDIIESNASYKAAYDNVVEKNARAGNPVSGKAAHAEAAAEIGRKFMPKTAEDMDRLVRKVEGNTTLFDKIYENIRFLRSKFDTARKKVFVDEKTGFRATYDEVYQMEKALENALTKVDKSKIGSGSEDPYIRYSVSHRAKDLFSVSSNVKSNFGNQVDTWMSGQMKSSEQFMLGKTPVYLRELGAKNLDVEMSQDVMFKITGGKHSISTDEIKKLPDAISDPIMVFRSATVKNALVILVEMRDKFDNDVVVAMHLNRGEYKYKINKIASVYGKNNIETFVDKQVTDNNLLYINKKKSKEWSECRGLRLPKLNTILSSNGQVDNILDKNIILQKYKNVNPDNTVQYRVKDQTDVMKYGRNVQDDVDRFATQRGIGLYKLLGNKDVASRVKSAYDLYDAGDAQAGYNMLKQIGDDLEKNAKSKTKPGEISQKFAESFEELYIRGRNNKASAGNYKEYENDKNDLGINIPITTEKFLAEENASLSVTDRMVTEKIIREAYTELKFTGDETRARELLRPAAEKIVSDAKDFEGNSKYIDNKAEATDAVLDRMIGQYKDEQPASRYGKDEIIAEDNRKYGKDIETVARNVAISNLKEGDAKKIGEVIRSSIDTVLGDKNFDLAEVEGNVADVIMRITTSRQLSPLEKTSLAETINYEIIEAVKRDIAKRETIAKTVMQEETDKLKSRRASGDMGELQYSDKYEEAKAELDLCHSRTEKLNLMFGEHKGQYKLSSPAKKAHRVIMNAEAQRGFMGEIKSHLGEMVYRGITEQETAEYGMNYVRSHDNYDTFVYLQNKAQWDRMDMGTAAALTAQFGLEGDYERAAQVFIMAQQFATKSGQISQAMRLFYCLTPEGKVAWYIKTQQNKLNADLGKTDTPESNKALVERVTQTLEAAEKDADKFLIEHDASHKKLVDTQDKLKSDLHEFAKNQKQLEAELETESRRQDAEDSNEEWLRKMFRTFAQNELREKSRKWGIELPEEETEKYQKDDISNESKFVPNRSADIERVGRLVKDTLSKITELDMKNKKLDILIEEAEQRAEADFKKRTDGYSKKEIETEKKIRANEQRMRELRKELRKLQIERNDNIHQYLMVNADKNGVYVKETSSSWFKLKKSGADKTELKTHLDSVLDELGIEHISRGDFLYFRELVGTIDDMDTSDELLDLIMDMSKRRNTAQFEKTENIGKGIAKHLYEIAKGKKEDYSYSTLTNKKDMKISVLDEDDGIYKADGTLDRAYVINKGVENVRQKNNAKNTSENAYVYVPDVDKDIMVSLTGLRHSLSRNAKINAKVTLNIGDILENSIKVNELKPRENTSGGYVLLGISRDVDENVYPVRMVVNKFNEVESIDVLYAINAKKRRVSPQTEQGIADNPAPLIKDSSADSITFATKTVKGENAVNAKKKNQSPNGAELSADAGSLIKGSSTISIANLLNLVKNDFPDVFTNDVLKNIGTSRKNSTLSDSIKYSDKSGNTSRLRVELTNMLNPETKEYNLLKSALKKVEKDYGLDTLKDIATQQVFGIISDLDERTTAGKAKTMMHIAQLLNFRTIGRNIFATAGFSGVDTLTNNLAYLVEKTHNYVKGKGFTSDALGLEPLFDEAIHEAAGKRRNMAFVEQALNVNILNNENARLSGPLYKRQFTKGIGGSLERMLGYALYVPDESFKGAVGERVKQSLEKCFMPREIDLSMVDEMTNKFGKSISVSGQDTTDYEGIFADVMKKHINNGGITNETLDDIEESIRKGLLPKGIFDNSIGTKTNFATQDDVDKYVDYSFRFGDEKAKDKDTDIEHQKDSIVIGKSDDRLINDLKKYYGIDFSNAYHYLRDNNIRHIKNHHGEGTNEKYPVTAEDIKQIPDIISNYDDVYYIKHPDGKEGLYYVKRHNGTTYYLEGVYDNYKTLVNFQMIKTSTGTIPTIPLLETEIKKRNSFLTRNGNNTPSAYVQDVQGTVSKDSISQNERYVNKVNPDVIAQKARDVIADKLDELKVYQKAYDDVTSFMMLYRTFQDNNKVSEFSQGTRELLNKIGVGRRVEGSVLKSTKEFGVGDFFNPYAKVGGNVINRFVEYSPLGIIKTVYDICDSVKTIRSGETKLNRFKNMPDMLKGEDKAGIRVDEFNAKRKAYTGIAKGLEAGMLIWAGWALAQSGVITGTPSAGAEEDFEQARNNDSYGLNLSMLKRFLDGNFNAEAQHDDYVMNIAWLSPVFTLMSVGAYCADKDNDKHNVIENLIFGSGEALWEQVNALSLFSNINRTINNFKYADDWKDGLVATGADMLLSWEPSLVRQFGNSVDDYSRDPYHGENAWDTAWNRFISRSPIKTLRENVPMRVDIFGQAKKTTLGNKPLDFLNNMLLPGNITQYKTNKVADKISELAGGDEELYDQMIPKTPYRTNTGELEDGTPYTFELNNKDYERYSNLLGMTTYKAMENLISSDDFKYLTKSQQIDAIAEVSLQTSYEVEEIWAKFKTSVSETKLDKEIDNYVDSTKYSASNLVKTNTAKAYVKTDGVYVEDVIDTGYYVPYTEAEKTKAIQAKYSYIDKVKKGKWKNSEGVYSSHWTEEEKRKTIDGFKKDAEQIANGQKQKWQTIEGTWDDLTEEEKGIVLRNITKYPDKVTLPDNVGMLINTDGTEPVDITDGAETADGPFDLKWDAAEYDRNKNTKASESGLIPSFVPSNSFATESKNTDRYHDTSTEYYNKSISGGNTSKKYSGYNGSNYSKTKNKNKENSSGYTPRVNVNVENIKQQNSKRFTPKFNGSNGRFTKKF